MCNNCSNILFHRLSLITKQCLIADIFLCAGPPLPVGNLIANGSGSSVTISWRAPWSLDVTGVDHDIWYSVLIQNVTDEDRPTDILCTDSTNITETHYTFTPDHLSPCHVYNFTIIPANGAGLGERSDPVSGYVTKSRCYPLFTLGGVISHSFFIATILVKPRITAINSTTSRVIFETLVSTGVCTLLLQSTVVLCNRDGQGPPHHRCIGL